MPSRAASLQAFYDGPVWQAHRDAANATMIDSDNVLLLRPAADGSGFTAISAARAPAGAMARPSSRVLATIYSLRAPADDSFRRFFCDRIEPALSAAEARPIATLETEPAKNTFPRLPVREGEHVFVSFARFEDDAALRRHETRLASSPRWAELEPALREWLTSPPERLVLEPTARSRQR
jgi:hypothetical protein